MKTSISPAVRRVCDRYRTQGSSIRANALEFHSLASLPQRLLLSPEETLEQVSLENLVSFESRNGKHLFSARSLDALRNRVVDFITGEIVEELAARGFGEDRICFALERAFQKQFELSRGTQGNVVEFARTPGDDDDDHTLRNAALLAGGAAAGYGAYRYMKGGIGGNALPGGSQGQLPTGPKPSGDAMGAQHPGPPSGASMRTPVTTASPTPPTVGSRFVDPLTAAVQRGKTAIAQRGSAVWRALRSIPLE